MAAAHSTQVEIGGRKLTLETGRVAKQADGSVVVRYGDTVVLATVVASRSAVEGQDFFPLSVDYRERAYAGGRIPGGFFKREGRPAEKEILTSRLIDRPLRPLFPKGFRNEIQLIVLAISSDQENDPGILAMNGASAAVLVAGVPFLGPFGAVRIGHIDGHLVVNPPFADLDRSLLDLVVAGDRGRGDDGGGGSPRDVRGHPGRGDRLRARGVPGARPHPAGSGPAGGQAAMGVRCCRRTRIPRSRRRSARRPAAGSGTSSGSAEKAQRAQGLTKLAQEVIAAVDPDGLRKAKVREYLDKVEKQEVRRMVLEDGVRIDGRKSTEIRAISVGGVVPAARPRLGALHPRRDAGTGRRHARDQAGRAEGRVPRGRVYQAASCSTTTSRRSRRARSALRQSWPPRDRPRGARPALGYRGGAAAARGSSRTRIRDRLGHPRVQRLVLDGDGVRRLHGAHGRRRADQGAGGGHRDGAGQGGRARSAS